GVDGVPALLEHSDACLGRDRVPRVDGARVEHRLHLDDLGNGSDRPLAGGTGGDRDRARPARRGRGWRTARSEHERTESRRRHGDGPLARAQWSDHLTGPYVISPLAGEDPGPATLRRRPPSRSRYRSIPSSISVTRAATGERSERVSVMCAKSGWPLSAS